MDTYIIIIGAMAAKYGIVLQILVVAVSVIGTLRLIIKPLRAIIELTPWQ